MVGRHLRKLVVSEVKRLQSGESNDRRRESGKAVSLGNEMLERGKAIAETVGEEGDAVVGNVQQLHVTSWRGKR